MATALELVNRVRRQLRWSDTAAFTSAEDRAVLDAVNAAVAVIFERWDWECDVRHDGILRTMASATYTTADLTADSALVTLGDGSAFYVGLHGSGATNPIVYAVGTGDASYGDTAFRVTSITGVADGFLSQTQLTLATSWPGTTNADDATVLLVANTYVLPSTVRKVLSVRHQERDVALIEAEQFHIFNRAVQRPHDSISDNPDVVVMGGIETSVTMDDILGVSVPTVTNHFVTVWPTPSTELLLNYSYLLKRSEMTATTDTLANVDRALEDLVVQLAYSRCVQNYVGDADAGTGMAIEQRVLGLARDLHSNQTKDPNRRRVMMSNFDERAYLNDVGRFPRNFGSN